MDNNYIVTATAAPQQQQVTNWNWALLGLVLFGLGAFASRY